MSSDDACFLTAGEARARMEEGRLSSEELVKSCLARVAAHEETVRAWTFLDPELALEQAREADRRRRSGRATGPLNGIPVGLKDIFDTKDMPTEVGSPLYAGRRPARDSAVAEHLREAGAIILGKTVTTEFAFLRPGKTRNPNDPTRTPGGSSSGSAAAVAAFMVPLAIGSQTNGSVIRPASFCNVVGFKPGFGLISRHRALQLSRTLDHVGVFARCVEDAALLAEALAGYDRKDPDTQLAAHCALEAIAASEPPMPPRFAFVRSPVWDEAEDDTKAAFEELVAHLGDHASEVMLPDTFREAHDYARRIMSSEMAVSLQREFERGGDQLSEQMRSFLEEGRQVAATDYIIARDRATRLRESIGDVFHEYDAILTPAAPGEPPVGFETTGNPVFCTIWTLLGLPATSLPILQGANGMPIGAQLVGAWQDDARLLRTARWLAASLAT